MFHDFIEYGGKYTHYAFNKISPSIKQSLIEEYPIYVRLCDIGNINVSNRGKAIYFQCLPGGFP
jgi:hypothetical protein